MHDHLVLTIACIGAIPLFAACTIPGPIRRWLETPLVETEPREEA